MHFSVIVRGQVNECIVDKKATEGMIFYYW